MENGNQRDNSSKQILLSVLGVAILVVAVVGISFATFTYTKTGDKENTISTGTISMSYTTEDNGIKIENAMPTSDATGKTLTQENEMFDFTVEATMSGATTIDYEIAAEKVTSDNKSTLGNNDVHLYLQAADAQPGEYSEEAMAPKPFTPESSGPSAIGTPEGAMKLYTGQFKNTTNESLTQKKYFRLKMWVAETAKIESGAEAKKFTVKVNVYGKGSV